MTLARSPFEVCADLFDPPRNPYVDDPSAWVRDRLDEHLWSVQSRIMEALRDHRRVAVRSCHGAGKSWTAARAAAWWLDSHPSLEAFVVTSAPTDSQVKAILWREITRAHRKGKLPGRVTQDAQWKISDELVGFGRKPADIAGGGDDETVTAFQGIHARYPLVVFDEAGGIARPLWIAANSLLTNDDARFLAIGNPDDPTAEFAAICEGAPEGGGLSNRGWYVIPISIFDTPNFTDEDVPPSLRPYLPGWTWLEMFSLDIGGAELVEEARRIAAGGKVDEESVAWTSPLFMSKVLGQFPEDAKGGVVPWTWIQRCRGEDATARIGPLRVPVELGVDVGASDNGDFTVIRERQGMRAGRRWTVRSGDPEKVAAEVVTAARVSGATTIKIDSIGIGWAMVALVQRDLPGVTIVPVNVSEAAKGEGKAKERFVNVRSQLWWEVGRGLTKDGAWDLTDVDDRTLADLSAPRWWENASGRIQIEEKADVRKRLGRSPDDADALLLAFWDPPETQAGQVQATDQRLTSGRRAR